MKKFNFFLEGLDGLARAGTIKTAKGEIKTALDIGCGTYSHLQAFRPELETTGLDAFIDAIDTAKKRRGVCCVWSSFWCDSAT